MIMTTTKNEIFVFGSNRAGLHGAGAALYARQWYGAIFGQGEGLQGSSYGIPTKDENVETLPLVEIQKHVDTFLEFARNHPELIFRLTPIGTGLAGYKYKDIGPMFKGVPDNVLVPEEFKEYIEKSDIGDDLVEKARIIWVNVHLEPDPEKSVLFLAEILRDYENQIKELRELAHG